MTKRRGRSGCRLPKSVNNPQPVACRLSADCRAIFESGSFAGQWRGPDSQPTAADRL